jgi:xylulokinase
MTDELILAIDQGTSAVKVIVFDLDGRIVAAADDETLLRHPEPTWIESDAESWWTAVVAGIRRVLGQPGVSAARIRAVGMCGFMHTLVPIDQEGRPLCAPLLWPDQRCAAEAHELTRYADLFIQVTGRPATTMSSVPRLRWLGTHHPEVIGAARAFLLPKDFLRLRLTGEIATDPYDARGTGLVDRTTGDWSEALLELSGVSPTCLPPMLPYDAIAGSVSAEAARITGLVEGTPVITGSGDWFTTIVGSGCYLPERACLYLGTAGIIGAFTSADQLARLGETAYFGSVTSTGSALRWIRQLFGFGDERLSYREVCEEAEESEPGARGLYFLPHLLGERGGEIRPNARGAFYGLTLAHGRADIFRSVLEGTALWLKATTEPQVARQPVADFLLMGGGARSPFWRQIVAAVYQKQLLVPEVVDGGALGAAMFAAVGTGLRRGYLELAAECVRVAAVEEPNPDLVERYASLYRDYLRIEATIARLESLPH